MDWQTFLTLYFFLSAKIFVLKADIRSRCTEKTPPSSFEFMAYKGHPQTGGMQATTTIIQQPTNVGPEPMRMICPSCHAEILTQMRYEATSKTHLIALLLCCFICWPCVCLPYCMDSCQNGNHYCPNCHAFIGTYKS